MAALKTFTSFVVAAAVGMNAVAAVVAPCCCARLTESRDKVASTPVPACCAHGAPHSSRAPGFDENSTHECGCAHSVPLAATEVKATAASAPSGNDTLWFAGNSTLTANARGAFSSFQRAPDASIVAGPPLLALYCIWLK